MQPFTEQSLLAGIQKWVECESPSHNSASLHRMADLIASEAQAAHLSIERFSEDSKFGSVPILKVSNRLANDTRKGILILAHFDTVHPLGTLAKNPCRVEEGKFYGPGSYDMKAGTYLAFAALQAAAQQTRLPVELLLVPDEEVGSHASRKYIEEAAQRAVYTLVAEPARANGGNCVTARKGQGLLYLTAKGRPSHAGMAHEKGRSAIKEIAHQIIYLESLTNYEEGVTLSVGTIQGGTTVNVVPSECKVEVDFRIPTLAKADSLLKTLKALQPKTPDVTLEIEVELNRPPMERTEKSAALCAYVQNIAKEIGFTINEHPMTGGASDANFTSALGVPSLDGLGAEGDGAHTLHEHILVASVWPRFQMWQKILLNLDADTI